MGSVILLVAIETKNTKITRGAGVGRKKEIDDLIAAFDRVLHEDHLNSERANCPGRAALMSLANELRNIHTDAILDHVRQCAACLDELKTLRTSLQGDV
jgi:hypothetical protein